MRAGERRKHLGVTARRPRHFENDLLDRMGAKMENVRRQRGAFLRRSVHDRAVVVARSAIQIGHAFHRPWPKMFLVADRTRAVLDHVRFVQIIFFRRSERRIFLVALLAFVIDCAEIDPAMKPIFDDALEFRPGQVIAYRGIPVVALGALLFELRVLVRKFS